MSAPTTTEQRPRGLRLRIHLPTIHLASVSTQRWISRAIAGRSRSRSRTLTPAPGAANSLCRSSLPPPSVDFLLNEFKAQRGARDLPANPLTDELGSRRAGTARKHAVAGGRPSY